MKYHPGKILNIFSPKNKNVISADAGTQALLEMWDENILTAKVAAKILPKLKEGDYVIVDYNPISEQLKVPKVVVTKIIRGDLAKKMWRVYKTFLNKKKKQVKQRVKLTEPAAVVPARSYG